MRKKITKEMTIEQFLAQPLINYFLKTGDKESFMKLTNGEYELVKERKEELAVVLENKKAD